MSVTPTDFKAAKENAENLLQPYGLKGTPGGMAAVVQGTDIIWSRHFGMSDVTSNVPNLPGTRHALASLTKMMTAAIILKLAARGKLDLQVAASTYIPDQPLLEQLTIAHLLTMTAGVPDHFDLMLAAGGLPGQDRSIADYFEILRRIKTPAAEPGTQHIYGNANYLFLAEIISGITGKSFADALRDEILTPLGMRDTYVQSHATELTPRTALPHVALQEPQQGWARGRIRHPADGIGNVFAPLSDLVKWLNALRSGTVDGVDISPLWSETIIGEKRGVQYGLGMMIRKYRGITLRGHMGRWPGYRSALFYAPELDMSFIVMANRSDFALEDTLFGLIDAFVGKALPLPPVDAQILANMQKNNLKAENMPKLNGTYFQPESGQVIKLHWQMPFLMAEMSSARMLMQVTSHGFFTARWGTTSCHIMPQVDKATGTIVLDIIKGGVRARFNRAETLGQPSTSLQDYTGDYMFEPLDAKVSITERNGRLYARIGALINQGEAFQLYPLAADLFEIRDPSLDTHAYYTLRFDREPSSRIVRQMSLSGDRLPRLTYRKLRSF